MRVRTVTGDLPPDRLGVTDYHDHLFQVSPLLPGDELNDEPRSTREAEALRDAGFTALVHPTPIGLGRRPGALARISRATGLRIVAATGAHREAHYPTGHRLLELSEPDLAHEFTTEITDGMPAGDVGPDRPRAGLIKTGIDYWRITSFEHRVLAAAAAAHHATQAPIMVHLEHGSAAFEVVELLAGHGVEAAAVALAHADRNPDAVLHAELAAAGVYLGYDGFARTRLWPDTMLLDCLARTAELGGRDRLLIGGDVGRGSRYVAYGGLPGLAYLGRRIVPRLQALDADLADAVLVRNPARWLARFPAAPSEEVTR